jgi:hypothetical protein
MMSESELREVIYEIVYRLPRHDRRHSMVLRILAERYLGKYDPMIAINILTQIH